MRGMATLELHGLRKSFGLIDVLHGIDLTLADGEMLVIVGASGCGKSTLLRLVAGLERPTAGQVVLEGRDVTQLDPSERDIAMVFQNYALYPHMTVFENMAFGLKLRGMAAADIDARVREAAELLRIGGLLDRKPRHLSGGEQQRVALGRALVRKPDVFLFDEPLSNLDAKLRVQMRREIARLHHELGATMLYVTHDQAEAMTLGDRIVVLNGGKVQQIDTPLDVYRAPRNTFVAGFIGSPAMNLVEGTVASEDGALAFHATGGAFSLLLPPRWRQTLAARDGRAIFLGIRPEDVRAATEADTGVRMRVDLVEPLGQELLVTARLGEHEVIARLPPAAAAQPGQDITLGFVPDALHFFDAETRERIS